MNEFSEKKSVATGHRVTPTLHHELKILAAQQQTSVQQLIDTALDRYVPLLRVPNPEQVGVQCPKCGEVYAVEESEASAGLVPILEHFHHGEKSVLISLPEQHKTTFIQLRRVLRRASDRIRGILAKQIDLVDDLQGDIEERRRRDAGAIEKTG